jgi:hypothetical protein
MFSRQQKCATWPPQPVAPPSTSTQRSCSLVLRPVRAQALKICTYPSRSDQQYLLTTSFFIALIRGGIVFERTVE